MILHVFFLICVYMCVCVFMYSRTIAHVELMLLLIKPTLNRVYFTLLYFTGSDNGLAPARRQAIIWSNDGKFTDAYMRHSASMS